MNNVRILRRRGLWQVAAACAAIVASSLSTGDGHAQSVPRVNGDINTHVLNAVSGQPATGMTVELLEVQGETVRRLSLATLSQRAAQETLPLRDAFAVLFFVSVVLLFNQ